jgi:hypothetical protein
VFNAVTAHLKTERNATIRQRLLYALIYITDKAIMPKIRAMILGDELRVNEVPTVIYGLVSRKANVADGWAWFKENFDAIEKKTPPGSRGRLLGIGDAFCSAAERNDYVRFFEKRVNDIEGAPRTFKTTQEVIATCIALKDAQGPKAAAYFAKR